MQALRAMRGWWLPLIWGLLAFFSLARGRVLYGLVFLGVTIYLVADQEAKRRGEKPPGWVRGLQWTAALIAVATAAYMAWLFAEELYGD